MAEWKKTPDGIEIPPPGPDDVLYQKQDGIARITMNRPVVLNALNKNMQRLLHAKFSQAETDDEVRVVILTGAGRSFCAGGDMWSSLYPDDQPAPSGLEVQAMIWSLSKPVIAAVRGHAVGQGCELAGVCDFTIAAEDARLGEIQIRHAAQPPVLITPFLVSMKQAKELLLLGEMVDASEALRMGLVNRVVPGDRLDEEAETWARKLSALPQPTVRLNKMLVNRVYELAGLREAFAYRDDPAFEDLVKSSGQDVATQERIRLRQEVGWQAFLRSRDAMYKKDQP